MLLDRAANRMRTVMFWESEADFQATVAWAQGHIARFGEFLAAPPVVDGFDVVAEIEKD